MTRIWYDTEFCENGRIIDLISIGMVAEDGCEYYAINSDADWNRIKMNDWLVRNVVPHLPVTGRNSLEVFLKHPPNSYPKPLLTFVGLDLNDSRVRPTRVIANEVRDFILSVPNPELWAWYGAYDHVALCQLWGQMAAKPEGVPMYTNDLKQEVMRLGNPRLPPMPNRTSHDALSDAQEVRYRHLWLQEDTQKKVGL